MSRASSPTAPALARVLVMVLVLLVAPLAAAPAGASVPPPAAASSSCEPGEGTRDVSEEALRLSTGHPVRLLTAPPSCALPHPRVATRPGTTAHPAPPSHRALRTVVLRC